MRVWISRLRQNLRHGNFWDALRWQFGLWPTPVQVKYYGTRSVSAAVGALVAIARRSLSRLDNDACVLSLGDGGTFHCRLDETLRRRDISFRSCQPDALTELTEEQCDSVVLILCAFGDSLGLARAAKMVARHSQLSGVKLEYAPGLDAEAEVFARRDEYANTFFVSPVLLDRPSPYALYEESLQHCAQKCGLRDYLDLYQYLRWVVNNDVEGDIAEFGSYRGHSGWLIARTLEALGSEKQLFMFDTFEDFPDETLGVDRFWSRTHKVDFEDVRSLLGGFEHVHLVKGDFTQTLESSALAQVALAYIDCDSYRATRYLIDALLPRRLSPRGLLVCEDYGHPALLGNRLAVHESLQGQSDCFQFFSQFSGLYMVLKLANRSAEALPTESET